MSYVAGRVGLIPKGEYSATTQYNKLDIVTYNNKGYIAKVNNIPVGTLPTNSNYFLESFSLSGYATTSEVEEMLSEYSTTEEVTDLVNSTRNNPIFSGSIGSNLGNSTFVIGANDVKNIFRFADIMTAYVYILGSNCGRVSISFNSGVEIPEPDRYNFSFFSVEFTDSLGKYLNIQVNSGTVNSVTYADGLVMGILIDYDSATLTYDGEQITEGSSYTPKQGVMPNFYVGIDFIYDITSTVANNSAAFGKNNVATGQTCAALGMGLISKTDNQTVIGKWNIEDTQGKYAFIIGNGTDINHRSNALAIKWNGEIVTSNF